jgi:hypothetical protein
MNDALFDFDEKPTTCPHCGRRLDQGTCVWCDPDFRKGRHRRNDQPTSVAGARSVAYRAGSQKALLSAAFEAAWPGNLSDEEAAFNAGIPMTSEYSKRCGELRDDGVIVQIEGITRIGAAGVPRLVSVFVKEGNSRGVPGTATKEPDDRRPAADDSPADPSLPRCDICDRRIDQHDRSCPEYQR